MIFSYRRGRNQQYIVGNVLLHKMVLCRESTLRILQSDRVQPDAVCRIVICRAIVIFLFLQLLRNLEGIRYVIEVLARLFATGHTIVSEKLIQSGHLCKLWESSIYHAGRYGEHGYLYNVSLKRF